MKTALELIAEERQRQINEEGWTREHDSVHAGGDLSLAAACYAAHPCDLYTMEEYYNGVHYKKLIPFGEYEIDEKKSELRKLIIAGALIVAEIDRLQYVKQNNQ
jgi:hypothetical protein